MSRLRQIVVDAAYDHDERVAGVGVGFPDQVYAIIKSNIVSAASAAEAEAKAIIGGLDHLADCDLPAGSRVLNDNRDVVRLLNGEDHNRHGVDPTTIGAAQAKMTAYGYEVVGAKRGRTKSAHRAARISLMAWRQGRESADRIGGVA